MDTRIEILKDDKWQALRLNSDTSIRYNKLINKIGNVSSREISHSNTFSIPYVYQNINILGLNNFNPQKMAKAMNTKYLSRYYVEEKLVQTGYVVINNADEGVIKLNFIDEALGLVERWGTMNYEELLKNVELDIPTVYADAILEMREYNLDKQNEVDHLGNISGKDYGIALFPNNLNQIGDDFQIDSSTEGRVDGAYNPYQCRPVYNVKAFFDLITESFGYTPTYDNSINWQLLEKTYMTTEEPKKNKKDESGGEQSETYPTVSFSERYKWRADTQLNINYVNTFFQTYSGQGISVNEIPNFVEPIEWDEQQTTAFTFRDGWMDEKIVFIPNSETGNAGTIRYAADLLPGAAGNPNQRLYFLWKNETFGGDVVIDRYTQIGINHTEIEISNQTSSLNGTYTIGQFPGTFGGTTSLSWNTGGDFKYWYLEINATTWAILAKNKANGIFTSQTGDGGDWIIAVTNTNPASLNSDIPGFISSWQSFDHADFIGDGNFLISGLYYGPSGGGGDMVYAVDGDWDDTNSPFSNGSDFDVDLSIDKTWIDRVPNGADSSGFIGVVFDYGVINANTTLGGLKNMTITETYLPEGVIVYDDYGQYIPDSVDMTHGASKKTIKKLVSSIMHKEGMLMDINTKLKTIKFFSYSHYKTQRENANFSDWSDFCLEHDTIVRNTDFGNGYAIKNRIGLSSPFNGNTYDINLDN